jgi:hypothetical protein
MQFLKFWRQPAKSASSSSAWPVSLRHNPHVATLHVAALASQSPAALDLALLRRSLAVLPADHIGAGATHGRSENMLTVLIDKVTHFGACKCCGQQRAALKSSGAPRPPVGLI